MRPGSGSDNLLQFIVISRMSNDAMRCDAGCHGHNKLGCNPVSGLLTAHKLHTNPVPYAAKGGGGGRGNTRPQQQHNSLRIMAQKQLPHNSSAQIPAELPPPPATAGEQEGSEREAGHPISYRPVPAVGEKLTNLEAYSEYQRVPVTEQKSK